MDINTMLEQNGLQMELKVTKDEDNKGKELWALVCLFLVLLLYCDLMECRSIQTLRMKRS